MTPLEKIMTNPSIPDAVAKTIRITTQTTNIPTDEFDRLIKAIRTGLANPMSPAKCYLAKESLETLSQYSSTRLLEEIAKQTNSD